MKEMLTESDIVMKELLSDEYLHKLENLAKKKAEEYKTTSLSLTYTLIIFCL